MTPSSYAQVIARMTGWVFSMSVKPGAAVTSLSRRRLYAWRRGTGTGPVRRASGRARVVWCTRGTGIRRVRRRTRRGRPAVARRVRTAGGGRIPGPVRLCRTITAHRQDRERPGRRVSRVYEPTRAHPGRPPDLPTRMMDRRRRTLPRSPRPGTDPVRHSVRAGRRHDRTAVVESATCCGTWLLASGFLEPEDDARPRGDLARRGCQRRAASCGGQEFSQECPIRWRTSGGGGC
jgi:hypothetical protein